MGRREPTVSVLVPVWNERATIRECIADVRAQVDVDWECVLALDGPSDGTRELVASEVAGDPRFIVLDRPHEGLVAALEAGRRACRGRLVARFDADDRMHPRRLALQVEAFARQTGADAVGVVTCTLAHGLVPESEDGISAADRAPQGMIRHVSWWNSLTSHEAMAYARFIDAPICHPSAMIDRALLDAAGGYRDGPFAEDHDLWLRLFAMGVRFGRAESAGPLVTWRERPTRATRVDARYGDEARRALIHRHLLAGPLAHGARRVRLWGAGQYGRWHGRHLLAAGVAIDDVIDIDPKKIGRTILGGVPVVGVESLGPPDGRCLLVCVASPGARALIAAELAPRGWVEGRDWWALQ